MIRFIFICMAFIIGSFALSPVFVGIQEQQQQLASISNIEPSTEDAPLSFKEIYALADQIDPASLNDIAPAAGAETTPAKTEQFSTGFSGKEDSALADFPSTATSTE